jgi:hypothetical protein
MPLQPQQALETAVVNAVIAADLGYTALNGTIGRTFDDRPPPSCGEVYVAVWSDNSRESTARTCLDERFQLCVTITLRASKTPFDRRVQVRDDLELRMNQIRALVHGDSWNFGITNAANALADFGDSPTKRPRFAEALAFLGLDAIREVDASWFHARPSDQPAGVAQTARFGRSRRLQDMTLMT